MDVKAEFLRLSDICVQVRRPPWHIVEEAVDNHWTFPVIHRPSEEESNKQPLLGLSKHPDEIAIDGLLGLYTPSTHGITIFRRGISRVAEILKASKDDLTQIVQLHEWAHALLHIGLEREDCVSVARDQSQWAERIGWMDKWFNGLDPVLHERLAQVLTHRGLLCLKNQASIPEARASVDRLIGVFERLMRRSPSAYRIDKFVDIPKNRIISSICLLKSGGLIGADAWETVVTW
jgi:hypothetical protein